MTCSRCRPSSRTRSGGSRPPGSSGDAGSLATARRRCWCAGWAAARSAATWPRPCSAIASQAARHRARLRAAAVGHARLVVLCASYSGNTEETLACYEAAGALGATRVAVTTGGRLAEPARARRRAGDPAPVGAAAACRGRLHARDRARGGRVRGVAPAHSHRDRRRRARTSRRWRRVGPRRRRRQPRQGDRRAAHGDACACTGPGPTRRAAYRWKTQMNENAKLPAFAAELPEADHNEIVGWEGAALGRALRGDLPRGHRPAPAHASAHRADRAPGGRGRRRHGSG